jgi:hypothetical protein
MCGSVDMDSINKTVGQKWRQSLPKRAKQPALWRRVRKEADAAYPSCRIEVVEGDVSPVAVGEHGHYETPNGKPVIYPQAYKKAGGRCKYICSSYRVEVGLEWIKKNATPKEIAAVCVARLLPK